jgi:hypothetical protein
VLDLTLEAATCFHNNHRYVELPQTWWTKVPASQRKPVPDDIDEACDANRGQDPGHWLGFPAPQLAKQRPGASRLGVIAGRLPLRGKDILRVELDLASVLSEVPTDLHTAIVIDHSRSMSADDLEAQRAIVAGYLRAVPTSRVQVIGYARTAEALLATWMVASHAAPRLDRTIRSLPPRNGSNVDDALVQAAKWLAGVNGTKRIILFSDERLPQRIEVTSETLHTLVASDTLVHVVRPNAAIPLQRVDGLLVGLAVATEGIEVFGGASESALPDAMMLARPTEIAEIAIDAGDWEQFQLGKLDCFAAQRLREGRTCSWWAQGEGTPGPITIRGKLWNKPFKRVVMADPTQARQLARTLSVSRTVDADIVDQVDKAALAINSAWSLVARWGGSGGYEDLGGFGSIGMGRISTASRDVGIGRRPPISAMQQLDLRDQLSPAIARCQPRGRIELRVETTLEEIVGVSVAVSARDEKLYACITEAVWDTTLLIPNAPPHATSRVAFGNEQ